MGSLSRKQLKKLFAHIDARLSGKSDMFLIGGASAILGYNVVKETNDVDVDGPVSSELENIFKVEAEALKLDPHLSQRGVFSPLENYRERAKFEGFPRKKLRVWYLDQYDLAINPNTFLRLCSGLRTIRERYL